MQNIRIQKLGNVFCNDQQIIGQLVFYLVFSLLSYHSFQTFEFINIFPSKEYISIKTTNYIKSTKIKSN
jgi:hypothetical protein